MKPEEIRAKLLDIETMINQLEIDKPETKRYTEQIREVLEELRTELEKAELKQII